MRACLGLAALSFLIMSPVINSASIHSSMIAACNPSSAPVNTFPGTFQLRAVDPSTSKTYVVAHYPQFSFNDPGNLEIFNSPPSDRTSIFALSNYSLSDRTARCSVAGPGQGLFGEPDPEPTQLITCAYNFAILSGGFPNFSIGCHADLHVLVLQMAYPESTVPRAPCDKFYVPISTTGINPGLYGITPRTSRNTCDHYPFPDRRILLKVIQV